MNSINLNNLPFKKGELLETIFQCSGDAVRVVSAEGVILAVNQEMEKLSGSSAEESVGKRCCDIFKSERCNTENCPFKLFTKEIKRVVDKEQRITKDGKAVDVELIATPLYIDSKIYGAIESYRDISEKVKAERELKEACIKAQDSSRVKSLFLANMSHEIRTPMNAIIGITDLALMTNRDKKVEDYLETVKDSAESLLHVINDILEFSRAEAGKIKLERRIFSLRELIIKAISTVDLAAKKRSLELKHKISDSTPDSLYGASDRIYQVLINLLNNAVKFTEQGSVTLLIDGEQIEENAAISFSIIDTGIGIEAERIDSIFESFSQAEESITRRFGGTGLGLTISKMLVELMDGTISVESTPGKGSCFTFTIPLELRKEFKKEKKSDNYNSRKVENEFKILLVEDNKINRKMMREMIKNKGCTVLSAENGIEAFDIFKKSSPDLILMDMMMPIMNGLESAEKIRAYEVEMGLKKTPIAALTANVSSKSRDACIDSGMDEFLGKPLSYQELYSLIDRYSQINFKEKELPEQIENESKHINIKKLIEVVGGNREIAFELINEFIDENPGKLKKIETQIENREWGELKHSLHTMKGQLLNLRISKSAKHFKDIEDNLEHQNQKQIFLLFNRAKSSLKREINFIRNNILN
jgi:two-component system, sensor histidine kinase and response regulator